MNIFIGIIVLANIILITWAIMNYKYHSQAK